MPYDVPLRHIIVTMLDPSTCSAHIAADFAAAMARFRKNRWLPDRNCASSTRPASGSAAICGSRLRISRLVVPCVRMCTSSPIWTPWAARAKMSMRA